MIDSKLEQLQEQALVSPWWELLGPMKMSAMKM
jgi:hypothetical protein